MMRVDDVFDLRLRPADHPVDQIGAAGFDERVRRQHISGAEQLGDHPRDRRLAGSRWPLEYQVQRLVAHRQPQRFALLGGTHAGFQSGDLLFDVDHADEVGEFCGRFGSKLIASGRPELAGEVALTGLGVGDPSSRCARRCAPPWWGGCRSRDR